MKEEYENQNIYDNIEFFNGYKTIRENDNSANNIEETPALFSLLPDLKNQTVLDLGCGYGDNCRVFSEKGASYVTGIDISVRMLSVANAKNKLKNIEYLQMQMEDISDLARCFDIITSSLAMHYIADYYELVTNIFNILNPGGYFVFSQEHPLITSPKRGVQWATKNKQIEYYCLSNYTHEEKRDIFWIVDGVIKYHRPFSAIINPLIQVGFNILEILEPSVSIEIIEKIPDYIKNRHVPNFLLLKVQKPK